MNPELQAARLAAVINRIIADPESWNQAEYHCGTVHCFAGHADILAGYWDPRRIAERAVKTNSVAFRELTFGVGLDERRELESSTAERARRWLGLSEVEAEWLFDETTPFDWMYRFVAHKAAALDGRGIPGSIDEVLQDIEYESRAVFSADGTRPVKDYPPITLPGEPPV